MDKNEIIERLERLARCAVHTVGELPFVMSLDDGIAIHEAIDMLRSQSEPHWIPCDERLPENSEEVLITYIANGNKNKRYTETATYYDGDDGFWVSPWDEYRVAGTRIDVIAWMPMPLPAPYEGDNDGTNR